MGVSSIGVEITDLTIVAPSLDINGIAMSGDGVNLQGLITLSTISSTVTGHSNNIAVKAFSAGGGAIDVIGGSLMVIGDGTWHRLPPASHS